MTIIRREEALNMYAAMNEILGDSDLTNEQKHKAIFSDTIASKLAEALLMPLEVRVASNKGELNEFATKCKEKMEYLLSFDTQYKADQK